MQLYVFFISNMKIILNVLKEDVFMSKIIMGISLPQRVETAQTVQGILTEYGCYIQTRLGVHQASQDACSPNGLIILELIDGADKQAKEMEEKISVISDAVIKKMKF